MECTRVNITAEGASCVGYMYRNSETELWHIKTTKNIYKGVLDGADFMSECGINAQLVTFNKFKIQTVNF